MASASVQCTRLFSEASAVEGRGAGLLAREMDASQQINRQQCILACAGAPLPARSARAAKVDARRLLHSPFLHKGKWTTTALSSAQSNAVLFHQNGSCNAVRSNASAVRPAAQGRSPQDSRVDAALPVAKPDASHMVESTAPKTSTSSAAHDQPLRDAADHSARRKKAGASDKGARRKPGPLLQMGRRTLLAGATAGFCCPLCRPGGGGGGGVPAARADVGWNYTHPDAWRGLCATSETQSPIDIPLQGIEGFALDSVGPLGFAYGGSSPNFRNTGHGTMQVDLPPGGNQLFVGTRRMGLLQYHFHTPSEHSFNGVHTAMEAHLVHQDPDGSLAVVGVMMDGSSTVGRNMCLEAALRNAPKQPGKISGPPPQSCPAILVDPNCLLPAPDTIGGGRSYFHYKGSLTTPPCSEAVEWFLLAAPLLIPHAQVVEAMLFAGDQQTLALTSRPTQPIKTRTIFLGP